MSDQQSGQSENGAKPNTEADSLSSRSRTAPVIQGDAIQSEAVEVLATEPEPVTAEFQKPEEPRPDEPKPEYPQPEDPKSQDPKSQDPLPAPAGKSRKNASLRPLVATVGACVLGVAGYYGRTEWASREAPPPQPLPVVALATPGVEPKGVVPLGDAPEIVVSPVEAPAVTPSPAVDIPKAAEAPVKSDSVETRPVEAKSVEAKSIEPPPEPVKISVAEPASEKALADMAARLAATQATLEQVTQRLQAVEGQLAAPKTESRALLAAREAGPSNAGDVSARIVAAQSLLSAIRQGDDYAPMLAALQNLGGDSDRLARLRAGLTAPDANRLAKDFAALAPKILASVVPPSPAPPQAKAPQNFGESALAFLESRAEKLVRIRPAGAPENDVTAIRVAQIEKDLAHGDLAAALAERASLPAPALALTADWAAGAQTRVDAELAAKAELAAALQGLNKSEP